MEDDTSATPQASASQAVPLVQDDEEKVCPICGAFVRPDARKCKYCDQRFLVEDDDTLDQVSARSFMTAHISVALPLGLQEQLGIWIAWTLVTILSAAMFGALQHASSCMGIYLQCLYLPVLLGAGIGLGAAQWLVLRHAFANAKPWIIATGMAWILGLIVEQGVAKTTQTQFPGLLFGGLMFGTAQALVLRRLAGAAWWVPATLAGVILATLGLSSIHDTLANVQVAACSARSVYVSAEGIAIVTAAALGAIRGASFGLAIGGLTGGALIWLLRSQSTAAPSALQ
jgi:hypothetical protein